MKEKLKTLDRNIIIFVAIIALLVVGLFAVNSDDTSITANESVNAQEADNAPTEQQPENSENTETNASPGYSYAAQPGDSYTKMARKAIQTYGIENNVNLTPAQIIYAETTLTKSAQAKELNIGEEVSFGAGALKGVIEDAASLDETAEANWERYVQFVDFNTDSVGEKG